MIALLRLLASLSFAWSFGCAAGPLQLGVATPALLPAPQEVVRASECIGPVVLGVCHGAVLPGPRPRRVCHGTLLHGMCIGVAQ